MRTIVIDLTGFDQDEATKDKRVVYGFRQNHFDDPHSTIREFRTNPLSFQDGQYKAILTEGQNARLIAYLQRNNYWRSSFTQEEMPNYLLAFSYGENPDVNMQLAKRTAHASNECRSAA